MAQFKAFSPNAEVNGETVLALVDGMGTFRTTAVQVLAEHGLSEPKAGQWYRQQAYLDAYRKIAEKTGAATLKTIGRRIPENAKWPPGIDTIEKALSTLDVAYHMNHRGGEIGHYRFEKTGDRSGKMVCQNPYPCPFDLGLVEATARKFAPPGARVAVVHDDGQGCRLKGGESCTHLITW